MKSRFGLEHEVAFLDAEGQFLDFSNTDYQVFETIIDALPEYTTDYPQLRIGDAGIKRKRWYIEGYERFSETGALLGCTPKGIEIRTTIHETIGGAVAELHHSFAQLCAVAESVGLTPALTSFNPKQTTFVPNPSLNHYEIQRRHSSAEKRTSHIPMLTYGPDLNLSIAHLSTADLIRAGQKLTYYSPAIIPFSFSSPFYDRGCWSGPSVRTYFRTGPRPAAMVFVEHSKDLIVSAPSLTKIARIPAEVGRIEFKACDSCGDFSLYAGLLALIKGVVLDQTLPGLALIPDPVLHQHVARCGFQDPKVCQQSLMVLDAASAALSDPEEQGFLAPLRALVEQQHCAAQDMIQRWHEGESWPQILKSGYTSMQPALTIS